MCYDGRALRNGLHFSAETFRNLIWFWRGEFESHSAISQIHNVKCLLQLTLTRLSLSFVTIWDREPGCAIVISEWLCRHETDVSPCLALMWLHLRCQWWCEGGVTRPAQYSHLSLDQSDPHYHFLPPVMTRISQDWVARPWHSHNTQQSVSWHNRASAVSGSAPHASHPTSSPFARQNWST